MLHIPLPRRRPSFTVTLNNARPDRYHPRCAPPHPRLSSPSSDICALCFAVSVPSVRLLLSPLLSHTLISRLSSIADSILTPDMSPVLGIYPLTHSRRRPVPHATSPTSTSSSAAAFLQSWGTRVLCTIVSSSPRFIRACAPAASPSPALPPSVLRYFSTSVLRRGHPPLPPPSPPLRARPVPLCPRYVLVAGALTRGLSESEAGSELESESSGTHQKIRVLF
ncbi:hypothetical protein BC628DRAFT_376532 [Trametes gibbosa]|nr:hypothetical protein BC628DRAFT_376532 [Trametes gibbosa]